MKVSGIFVYLKILPIDYLQLCTLAYLVKLLSLRMKGRYFGKWAALSLCLTAAMKKPNRMAQGREQRRLSGGEGLDKNVNG
ncbi:MAG: hypothetical protein ACXWTH_11375 [Methylosarcina sp.]